MAHSWQVLVTVLHVKECARSMPIKLLVRDHAQSTACVAPCLTRYVSRSRLG